MLKVRNFCLVVVAGFGLLVTSCTKPTHTPISSMEEVPTWDEKGSRNTDDIDEPTNPGDEVVVSDEDFKPVDDKDEEITDPNNDPDGIKKKGKK